MTNESIEKQQHNKLKCLFNNPQWANCFHVMQKSITCDHDEFYFCPNSRFPPMRHFVGFNCSRLVIILPIDLLYFLQRGTQRDKTRNWAT